MIPPAPQWPKLEPEPVTTNTRCFLFAGVSGVCADGWLAYKGRFRDRPTAKQSCVDNGYVWGQIVIYDVSGTLWCVEDFGIDSGVEGWRQIELDEPYKRK